VGQAFTSGTSSAFMHDTLTVLKKEKEYAHIMGRIRSIGFAIPVIFILVLPVIAETSFRFAFIGALLIDVVGFFAVASMKSPQFEKHKIEEPKLGNFVSILKEFGKSGWLPFVLMGALIFGVVFGATAGFKNPYQEMLGFSLTMLGVLWAISRALVSVVLLFNGYIFKRFSFRQFIVLRTFVYALSFIGIGISSNAWLIAGLFILGNIALWGFSSADDQYYLNFINISKSKATLLSMKSLINNTVSGLVAVFMGLIVFKTSFMYAYMIMGLALLVFGVFSFFYFPVKTQRA
jgi:hypothetical protein